MQIIPEIISEGEKPPNCFESGLQSTSERIPERKGIFILSKHPWLVALWRIPGRNV